LPFFIEVPHCCFTFTIFFYNALFAWS
jgi:hypothetical protein